MKPLNYFLFFTFIMLVSAKCNRDDDTPSRPVSCCLQYGFVDDYYVADITYDGMGRPSSFKSLIGQLFKFYYNEAGLVHIKSGSLTARTFILGTNKLATVKISYAYSTKWMYIDSFYYKHDANGFITEQRVIYSRLDRATNEVSSSYGEESPVKEFVIVDGNMVSAIEKDLNGDVIKTFSYEYNNKLHAFSGQLPLKFMGKTSTSLLSKKTEVNQGGIPYVTTYKYQFDSNGNVVHSEERSVSEVSKNEFVWKCK